MPSNTTESLATAAEKSAGSHARDLEKSSTDLSLHSAEGGAKRDSIAESVDPYEVHLEPHDDPKNLSELRKWLILFVLCNGTLCSTCASSVVCGDIRVTSEQDH